MISQSLLGRLGVSFKVFSTLATLPPSSEPVFYMTQTKFSYKDFKTTKYSAFSLSLPNFNKTCTVEEKMQEEDAK